MPRKKAVKEPFLRVQYDQDGPTLVCPMNEIESGEVFSACSVGDKATVEVIEMTRAEYEALPEFES